MYVHVDKDFGPETERALRRVRQLSGTGANTGPVHAALRTAGACRGRVS